MKICKPLRECTGMTLSLVALAVGGCSSGESDGLNKYPVRGRVSVNGKPAAGIVVTFNNVDPNIPGNAARPVALAGPEGEFVLSTNADKDGAVEGEYAVTFFWPTDQGAMPEDRLSRLFAEPVKSKHRVRVEPKENDLPPFVLEIDPKRLKPGQTGVVATP